MGGYASDKLPVKLKKLLCALIASIGPSDGSEETDGSYGRKPSVEQFEKFLTNNTMKWQFNEKTARII